MTDEILYPIVAHGIDDDAGRLLHRNIQTLLALGTLAVYIRNTPLTSWGRRSIPSRSLVESLKSIGLPSFSTIPFHDLLDLPLPFEPFAAERLRYCHQPKMTSEDFLEDGEWVGCHCKSYYLNSQVDIDPPMVGIHFVVERSGDGTPALEAHGSDAVGNFDLRGFLDQQTSEIRIVKQYTSGPNTRTRWGWEGFMTPFGIAGYWGTRGYGGWVWLWKRHWVPQPNQFES